jgi:hypothetical protein
MLFTKNNRLDKRADKTIPLIALSLPRQCAQRYVRGQGLVLWFRGSKTTGYARRCDNQLR